MPQASDADRARYKTLFLDIGADHAIKVLAARGYVLTPEWEWVHLQDGAPSEEDLFLIGFLADEWDFGGLRLASGKGGGD